MFIEDFVENASIPQSRADVKSDKLPRRGALVTALGIVEILSWGSSYYLLAVLAKPIAVDTGFSLAWVVAGLSLALLAGGVASPFVGRMIEHRGGRPVLAGSSVLFAFGFGCLSLATSLPVYLTAWLIIGFAMGSGLYDAAFATLGRIYGQNARPAIALLTLFGGFASTVCWPLTAFLTEAFGWRGACIVYAGLHLAVGLPLNLFILPREKKIALPSKAMRAAQNRSSDSRKVTAFFLLAAIVTLGDALLSVISVHLISILQTRGMALMSAVALGALIGPAQVGARIIEMAAGRFYHPIWTLMASTILIAAGLALIFNPFQTAAVALAVILYGSGMGLAYIARGTVPLRIFGPIGYASLMGRLALPSLLAQALSPSLASVLLAKGNANLTITIVMGIAVTNVVLGVLLWMAAKHFRTPQEQSEQPSRSAGRSVEGTSRIG